MNSPSFNVPSLETMNRLLPAFEFTALIASNHSSAVFMAKQRSLDRNVAIKILAPHLSEAAEFRQSFETTARIMARLNHPNLIGVYDSGFVEGMLYFVMEFVPGKSLERSSRGHRVEFTQAVRLVEGICDGLSHSHAHGIVHGDLNPANILLNQKAEPKIGNFGFSHEPGTVSDPDAKSGHASFVAPETTHPPNQADPKYDIYAAGAILYQLLTAHPHRADSPPPSSLAKCTPAVDAIWQQATHPDPSQRFADMRTFRIALTELLKGQRPALSSGPPASERLAVSATPPESKKLGAAPTPPTPDTPKPPQRHRVGINWKLIRNLFIIAGLLFAISTAWQWRKDILAKRDREHLEALAMAEQKKQQSLAEARQRAEERASRPKATDSTTSSVPTLPEPKVKTESPEDSLARLRSALVSGDRTEMPVGTIRKGKNDYFLVKQPMSWPEAAWFAEQHGGHLAVPNASANLIWLTQNIPVGTGIWIGAGRSGRNLWALADGSIWKPAKEPNGTGQYLAMDRHGFLHAEGAQRTLPFVIQWHLDGSNPGSLESLLAITRTSLSQPNPVFPPGTRVLDNRHYLFVPRPILWRQAVDLAESSGGHLAVTSDIGEISRLMEMASHFTAQNGIWLGAFLRGDQWLWITGEPWKTAKWRPGSDTTTPGSALILAPGNGWETRQLSETSSGFIIEWSNDRKSKPTIPTASPPKTGNATRPPQISR